MAAKEQVVAVMDKDLAQAAVVRGQVLALVLVLVLVKG